MFNLVNYSTDNWVRVSLQIALRLGSCIICSVSLYSDQTLMLLSLGFEFSPRDPHLSL